MQIDEFFPSEDDEEEEGEGFEDYSNLTFLEKLTSKFEQKLERWIKEEKKEFYQDSFEYKNTTELKFRIYFQGNNNLLSPEEEEVDNKLTIGSNIILNEENDFPTRGHHLNRW